MLIIYCYLVIVMLLWISQANMSYLSISLCSILTCNSRSEEFGKDVTQRGQLKTPSRDGGDSGGKDGEVRSKCWRLICSSSLSGLSELYGHIGHSCTGSFGEACERSCKFRPERSGEPWPAAPSNTEQEKNHMLIPIHILTSSTVWTMYIRYPYWHCYCCYYCYYYSRWDSSLGHQTSSTTAAAAAAVVAWLADPERCPNHSADEVVAETWPARAPDTRRVCVRPSGNRRR